MVVRIGVAQANISNNEDKQQISERPFIEQFEDACSTPIAIGHDRSAFIRY